MEKCKATELTEQNITDEEKSAAATRTHTQRYRQAVRPERLIKRYLCVSAYRLDFVLSVSTGHSQTWCTALWTAPMMTIMLCLSSACSMLFRTAKVSTGCLLQLPCVHIHGYNGLCRQHLRTGIKNELCPSFKVVVHQIILLHQFPLSVFHGIQASLLCSERLSLSPSVCRCKQGSSRTAAAASS